jgi:hypothetical protein
MSQRTHTPAAAPRTLRRSGVGLLLGFAAACGTAACGGDSASGERADAKTGGKEQAARAGAGTAPACANADTAALALAVLDFITKATPSAQRYLNAVGTDSAVPEDGMKVLQDKGPTYFYSSDTSAQRQIRNKLAVDGPWASLLVVYRGQSATDDGNGVDIRLGGHYVGGEHDGKVHATKRYGVRCDSTGWTIATTAEEPGT